MENNQDSIISKKYNPRYDRILCVLTVFLAVLTYSFGFYEDGTKMLLIALSFVIYLLVDVCFAKLDYFDSINVISVLKLAECILCIFDLVCLTKFTPLYCLILLLLVVDGSEFILIKSMDDDSVIGSRKIIIAFIFVISLIGAYLNRPINLWYVFVLIQIATLCAIFYVSYKLYNCSSIYDVQIMKLKTDISDVEDNNNKLVNYQEKIKVINETINYQKIDLTRANIELEQVNSEINAQADVMKYMSSNYDVPKCMDYLVGTIMDIKKPKLVAMYIDSNVYLNQYSTCVIKTDYSLAQRRLKKEFDSIYQMVRNLDSESRILEANQLSQFKFVQDTSISTVLMLPIKYEKSNCGMMIIASDEKDYFTNGINYYLNCVIEFGINLKSIILYLKMQDMARKDGLTEIYNRLYFRELFFTTIKSIKRKKSSISVVLYDIDKFKSINDTYGHLAGDKVIKLVASIGNRYVTENEGFMCRFGGEEFVMAFPGKTIENTLPIIEKMHEEIKNSVVKHEDKEIKVNVCMGLTAYPEICNDTDLLVNRADMAMYYGKKHGRGRIVIDSDELE